MGDSVCIIGAGPSGITAAKNMRQAGIADTTVFEMSEQIGGNWVFREEASHSSVYETTHIISSKRWSQYEDFPMPADFPDYPGHHHLKAYFDRYAEHFDVLPLIRFQTRVDKATRLEGGGWQVETTGPDGEETHRFDYLLVANGHHWDPKIPSYPGEFAGELMHSHDFKRAEPFRDQRVLVVGAGNSACDVAVETARVARRVCLSMRRGQHIIPKFMFGKPTDTVYTWMLWLPRALRQPLMNLMIRIWQGPYAQYGLPEPEVGPLQMHPTLNSELLYFIRHGEIHPRPGIARFEGHTVHFSDGSCEDFDTVIFATGYHTSFPFLDRDLIDFRDKTEIPLYRKMIHADYDDLFFIGLFQPLGCIWPLADHQARIAAMQITGRWKRPDNLRELIRREVENPHFRFEKKARHAVEVDYHQFRKELLSELKKAS